MMKYYQLKKSGVTSQILFVILGDSHSGGIALNSNATEIELSERNRVKKWDNNADSGFQNLHIPVNSLIKHDGLSQYNGTRHGLDLELANKVYENVFGMSDVYLLKAGNGGSTTNTWINDTYYQTPSIKPLTDFRRRIRACLATLNNPNLKTYVILSIGWNDANQSVSASNYSSRLDTLIQYIRDEVDFTKLIIPKLEHRNQYFIDINSVIESKQSADIDFVEMTGATFVDGIHYSYAGNKLIMDRIINKIVSP